MALPADQQEKLNGIDGSLETADPRMAAKFAIFNRLTADDVRGGPLESIAAVPGLATRMIKAVTPGAGSTGSKPRRTPFHERWPWWPVALVPVALIVIIVVAVLTSSSSPSGPVPGACSVSPIFPCQNPASPSTSAPSKYSGVVP
jgi:hypothetical protein